MTIFAQGETQNIPRAPLSPYCMAGAGFFFMPCAESADRVSCPLCGVERSGWRLGHDALAEHKRLSPECAFAQGVAVPTFDEFNRDLQAGAFGRVVPLYVSGSLPVVQHMLGWADPLAMTNREPLEGTPCNLGVVLEMRPTGAYVKSVDADSVIRRAMLTECDDNRAFTGTTRNSTSTGRGVTVTMPGRGYALDGEADFDAVLREYAHGHGHSHGGGSSAKFHVSADGRFQEHSESESKYNQDSYRTKTSGDASVRNGLAPRMEILAGDELCEVEGTYVGDNGCDIRNLLIEHAEKMSVSRCVCMYMCVYVCM